MKRSAVCSVVVDSGRESLVSSAGGLLLARTLHCSGLEKAMSAALAPWRAPRAVHDPAKVLTDMAIAVALGGDCAADVAVVRAQPELFGQVASDATVSRLITTLAGDADAALAAIRTARATARQRVWRRQRPLPGAGNQVIIDLDATLVTAHSDKEGATPTFKIGRSANGQRRGLRTALREAGRSAA